MPEQSYPISFPIHPKNLTALNRKHAGFTCCQMQQSLCPINPPMELRGSSQIANRGGGWVGPLDRRKERENEELG